MILGFRKPAKILLEDYEQEVVSYDPKSERVEQLGVKISAPHRRTFRMLKRHCLGKYQAISYKECLVLLKGMDGLKGRAGSCSWMDSRGSAGKRRRKTGLWLFRDSFVPMCSHVFRVFIVLEIVQFR